MDALFEGSDLLAKDGSTVKAASLADSDVVGVYFSAHWCPPCKAFTPKAAATYEQAKQDGKKLEVVFVSSDKDEDSFNDYRSEMPWLSLPFAQRDLKAKLSKKFKVSGIPMLILLDAKTGKVISKDGRSALMKDPKAEKFPWIPPTVAESLGTKFVKNDKTEVDAKSVEGKYKAIYFSASWCGPCKNFTPKLIAAHEKLTAAGKDFEVIFVSADRDEKAFNSYFGKMPWLAVPFEDRDREGDLSALFGVEGIPHLALVSPEGKIVNKDLVGTVARDEKCEEFPWLPKPVKSAEEAGGSLNEVPALIVFGDEKGALDKPAKEAQEAFKKSGADEEEMIFVNIKESGAGTMGGQIKELCKLGDKGSMVLLDIPDEGGYYVHEGEVSEESVRKFIDDYKSKKLTRQQLG